MNIFMLVGIGWLVVSVIVALIWGRVCAVCLGRTEVEPTGGLFPLDDRP